MTTRPSMPGSLSWRLLLEPGRFAENVGLSIIASGAELLGSVAANLAVPLIAGVEAYAGYRTIVLYSLFVGTLHFGLVNGLYLYALGRPINSLSSSAVHRVLGRVVLLQLILVPGLGVALMSSRRLWAYGPGSLAIALVGFGAANISSAYAALCRATGLFRLQTAASLLSRSASLLVLIPALLEARATLPILAWTVSAPFIVGMTFQGIVLRSGRAVRGTGGEMVTPANILAKGFPLFASTLALTLLFNVDTLIVSVSFPAEKFAVYAFAYGLTSITYSIMDSMTGATAFSLARSRHERNEAVDPSVLLYVISLWMCPLVYWFGAALIGTAYSRFASAERLLFVFAAALPFGLLLRSRAFAEGTAKAREWRLASATGGGLVAVVVSVSLGLWIVRDLSGVALGWAVGTALAASLAVVSSGTSKSLLIHAAAASATFLCCAGLLTGVGGIVSFGAVALIAIAIELRREKVARFVA